MDKIGIYIHIPFCMSKCLYCSFNSYANKLDLQVEYIKSLLKEIDNYKPIKNQIDTIFIGGGTPSCLFIGAIATILSKLKEKFVIDKDAEITIEANPNSITKEKAFEWKESGINRVSVGLQTTRKNILKLIGRTHTVDDYKNAINILKNAGFNNINTDLMMGLPSQKQSDLKHAINLAVKIGSTHISCYNLIIEENTPIFELVKNNKIKLPKEEKQIGMYAFAVNYLKKFGFNRYEVSNFCLENFNCKHNLNCWNMHKYLGFGAGASGYIDNIRYINISSIENYIDSINKIGKALDVEEKQSVTDLFEETLMLGLRTTKGVCIDSINYQFKMDFLKEKAKVIEKLTKMELIEIKNNFLFATDKGFFVLNSIILEFVV